MTDKELRKLSRTELLKLLIEVTEENERLTEENERLRAGGNTILVDDLGRPMPANPQTDFGDVPASRLEEIFRSAEYAAGKFLKEAQDIADDIIADAEERAGVAPEERTAVPRAAVEEEGADSYAAPPSAGFSAQPSQGFAAQTYPQQTPLYGSYGMNGFYQNTAYQQNGYSQNYAQNGYSQGYGQNGFTQGYGQGYPQGYAQGYGTTYQPGQFYMYQPGMFQQPQQNAQAEEVNASFETENASDRGSGTLSGSSGAGTSAAVKPDSVPDPLSDAGTTVSSGAATGTNGIQSTQVGTQGTQVGTRGTQVGTRDTQNVIPNAQNVIPNEVRDPDNAAATVNADGSGMTPQDGTVPKKKKRQPTAMELLQGNLEDDFEDEGFEVELVSLFPTGAETPQMTLQEELASKRDPDQPMSALERLMIATRRDKEQAAKEERVKEAMEAKKVELQRNPYEHKPKGFPVKAQPKPETESGPETVPETEAESETTTEADTEL